MQEELELQGSAEDPELRMQSKCYQWHWNTFPEERRRLYHVNGKAKNKIEGSKFKAIGVTRGIADLAYLTRNCGTIYIELKTESGTQSKEQKEFMAQCVACGIPYYIVRSLEQFQSLIKSYQNV